MNVLAEYLFPEFRRPGKREPRAGQRPTTTRWKFATIFLKGDWEFLGNIVHLPRWDNADNMCASCGASNLDALLCWTRLALDGWQSTMRTHLMFLAAMRLQNRIISALWGIKTLTIHGKVDDICHALDLGVTAHVTADTFVEIMDSGIYGPTKESKISGLQAALKDWYDAHKKMHKINGELTFSRIHTSSDWPKLKCKAAAARHLARFSLKLARENNSGSQHDKDRLVVNAMLVRYYEIIEKDGMFHSEASKVELKVLGKAFMVAYKRLASEALAQDRRAWKIPAKTHLFCHLFLEYP